MEQQSERLSTGAKVIVFVILAEVLLAIYLFGFLSFMNPEQRYETLRDQGMTHDQALEVLFKEAQITVSIFFVMLDIPLFVAGFKGLALLIRLDPAKDQEMRLIRIFLLAAIVGFLVWLPIAESNFGANNPTIGLVSTIILIITIGSVLALVVFFIKAAGSYAECEGD